MPYDSRTYRILIASPSDVEEERELVVRTIQEWNDLHSYLRKVVLLPLRWETHTAPEYGARPQEVINRAVVDDCDLLVGVFWTRIGTPSGEAESGTLEEIDRVTNAGKPVMLYFSTVSIDPYKIDASQHERLKKFKSGLSSHALIETYGSHIEFRDKFSRQLEMKVRDLQTSDSAESHKPAFTLEIFSTKDGHLCSDAAYDSENLIVKDLDLWASSSFSSDKVDDVKRLIDTAKEERSAIPLVFVIGNRDTLALRNLFVEMSISPSPELEKITEDLPTYWGGSMWTRSRELYHTLSSRLLHPYIKSRKPLRDWQSVIDQWRERHGLTLSDGKWTFSFTWDALQPQRKRLVEPILYAVALRDTEIKAEARIYTDSLPKPLTLSVTLSISVRTREISPGDLIPESTLLELLKNE